MGRFFKRRRGTQAGLPRALQFVALGVTFVVTLVLVIAAITRPLETEGGESTVALEDGPRPLVVSWFGDSLTAGAGSDEQGIRFSSIVSRSLGYFERNYARGGTSWAGSVSGEIAPKACGRDYCPSFREMIEEASPVTPDLIIVSGGRNAAHMSIEELETDIREFFQQLRAEFPGSEVVATGALWGAEGAPEAIHAMSEIIEQEVTAIDGRYLDIEQPLEDHPDWLTDGVHPNNDGHRAIANAILEAWE